MDGKNFINTEKKYLSNLKDLIKNNKIKEAIKVLNEVEKKGFSEAFINNLIYLFLVSKLKNQENVGSFFDGLIIDEIKRGGTFSSRAHSAFRNFLNSKENRFIDFESRSQENCNISNQNRTSEMSVVLSQGTHSVFHWKNYIAFKSVFDLAIYSMLITELKPNIIIEIGSGKGGSAIWLADMMKILGLEPKVYSYDINKPNINYPGGFNRPHLHPNSLFSGVYYIKAPKNSGNIIFYDPRSHLHVGCKRILKKALLPLRYLLILKPNVKCDTPQQS